MGEQLGIGNQDICALLFCTKEMMPILGSLMDFALSTPDYCRRLLLPSQVARDEKKVICR